MAGSLSAKKTIPKLHKSNGEMEEKQIAFGTRIPGPREPKHARKSLNRSVKSLGGQDVSEENAMLRESVQRLDRDHKKMEEELERTVKDAHEHLANMKDLLDKKEQAHAALFGEVSKKNEDLEEQLSKYERKLVSSNIDPVSLENMEPSDEDAQAIAQKKVMAKVKVKDMRDKLKDMNHRTQTYLEDLQNMKRQLEELEDVSSRITMGDDSDEENVAQKQEPPSTLFLTQAADTSK
ncbi:M protein, serotype 2.1-like [Haliotis cracherodii]|uniref:M protein, serotype 2.1-like n=1 Tax=Haliotis cracherodii TaxID=6455 RepID=UPI0039EAEE12